MAAITSTAPCDRCHAGNCTARTQGLKTPRRFFVPLISCAGVGHGAGAHGRGVGGDLPVGARPRRLAAADRTEPGGALGKVSDGDVIFICMLMLFAFHDQSHLITGGRSCRKPHVCLFIRWLRPLAGASENISASHSGGSRRRLRLNLQSRCPL